MRNTWILAVVLGLVASSAQASESKVLKFYKGTWTRSGQPTVVGTDGVTPGAQDDPNVAAGSDPQKIYGLCGAEVLKIGKKLFQNTLKVEADSAERELALGGRYNVRVVTGDAALAMNMRVKQETIESGGILPGDVANGLHFERIVTLQNVGNYSPSDCYSHSIAGPDCFRRDVEYIEFRVKSANELTVNTRRLAETGSNGPIVKVRGVTCNLVRSGN
ncbi:MAG TPA: hypothetical protein VL588_08750 [Bdellovibrionota bacterium]|nr:hypothetical protein [Bdellovibrionota bacterium]